jgi:hypothetical protein
MYKCSKCEKSFEKYKSLSLHMHRTHNISSDQFYVNYYLNGIWPLCKCGCGEKVVWSNTKKSFCDLKHGHYSRIHNNWGNNPMALKKSLETRKERFETGEITTWNNGLTSETDDRVKKNGLAVADAFTIDRKKKYSKIMRENRLDGTVPTLHGPQHSQWKGGASSINVLVRARVKLYKDWKYPIIVRDGFKCVECGAITQLHVHHDKEQMCEIIQKHLVDDMTPRTFAEKEMIADAVVDYHIKNHVSGITLCGKCHKEKHPSLNFNT